MQNKKKLLLYVIGTILLVGIIVIVSTSPMRSEDTMTPTVVDKYMPLLDKVRKNGTIRVIVEFAVASDTTEKTLEATKLNKYKKIELARTQLLSSLLGYYATPITQSMPIPFMGLIVDEKTLVYLINSSQVLHIQEDHDYPVIRTSTPNPPIP